MTGIRQLADHLNISIGTVSRALNGKPDVNPETRRRVLEAAEKLGYVANQAGRALRKGKTGIVGFMMETDPEVSRYGDLFFTSVFDGVQSVLSRHQLDLVTLLCPSSEDPDAYLDRMVARGFADAIILSGTRRHDPRFTLLAKRKIPFIPLGRSLTDVGQPWIDLDFEGMAEIAVNRFVEKGHRRIGVIWPHGDHNLAYIFIDQVRETLARHQLTLPDHYIFKGPPNEDGGYRIARDIKACAEPPTAIILVNEAIVMGLYRGLTEVGMKPGKDVAIIGRYSPQAKFLSPSLTSFDLSLRDLGAALAETLLGSMPAYRQSYPDITKRRIWPMTLVEGESG
jgi:DNA-binding LacI/PurR family transcriptional regulator